MAVQGFENDARYFEFLAGQQPDKAVRNELLAIARIYISLAKEGYTNGTREEHWRKRAEECRVLSDQYASEFCRTKLLRLADAYALLSGDQEIRVI